VRSNAPAGGWNRQHDSLTTTDVPGGQSCFADDMATHSACQSLRSAGPCLSCAEGEVVCRSVPTYPTASKVCIWQ